MGSRTIMKQQIMRQMVMDEEKPHKEIQNVTNGNYNNSYKGSYNSISQNDNTLPSLTSTMVGSERNYGYCKPFMNSPNSINFNIDANNCAGDDLPFIGNDYNESIPSMYPMDNKFSIQSFNTDYSLQSSNIDNNFDGNSYNGPYHHANNKLGHTAPMPDYYGYETSFSCPVTVDQMTNTTTNQRRMSNSNSAVIGAVSLNYDDKRTQLKDRSKKESHNRIERKRRDFINQQIVELSNLLPAQMMSEGESKKNKGNILKNSVMYIQHLQNEASNTMNYVKETDVAFMLVESYRKQIQELQQLISSDVSQDLSLSPSQQSGTENYSEYLAVREQNRRINQSNNQLLLSSTNSLSTEMLNRFGASSYVKSPMSSVENGSAFKIEPSSAHSSLGNNSLSNTYRIDEETDASFHPLSNMLSPNITNQHTSTNYPPVPHMSNDVFTSYSHYRGIGRHKFESMEC